MEYGRPRVYTLAMNGVLTMLPYLVGIAAMATAIVLFAGLTTMGAEAAENARYSNLMMRWRVGLQGLTLALIALWFLLSAA